MASAREMRIRIRSIKNISQVTRALEAVSASKVRKAVAAVTATVFAALSEDVSKITAEDQEKLNWIKTNAEKDVDFAAIDALL